MPKIKCKMENLAFCYDTMISIRPSVSNNLRLIIVKPKSQIPTNPNLYLITCDPRCSSSSVTCLWSGCWPGSCWRETRRCSLSGAPPSTPPPPGTDSDKVKICRFFLNHTKSYKKAVTYNLACAGGGAWSSRVSWRLPSPWTRAWPRPWWRTVTLTAIPR